MRQLLTTSLLLFLAVFSSGQEYTAGRTPTIFHSSFSRFEVTGAWKSSSSEISVKNGSVSSEGFHGFSGRVLFYPWHYMSLGVEGILFGSEKLPPLIDNYKVYQVGLVSKLSLSPDTNPRIYMLFGVGKTFYQFTYTPLFRGGKEKKDITYLSAGLGLETDIYKNLFLLFEMRAVYHIHTELTRFYALKERWSSSARVGVGIRF